MAFFENGLKAKVMSTELIIEANVSKKILFECLDLAKEFESKYSAYKTDSLLSKINQNAGIKAIKCSESEIKIFQKAHDIAVMSNGLFDPTIGVLTQGTYGFGTDRAKIPSQKELNSAKKLVNFKEFSVSKSEVFLKQKGMRLDLGGIGKGYVADKIVEYLQARHATKGLVSVGGEIVCFAKEYNIAIRNPYNNSNLGIIKSSKSVLSVSTSGDYERYIGSKEHHHILDNTTARSNHYYNSITILKDGYNATLLDAVATIAFNSKKEHLKAIAQKYKVAIIAVMDEGELYIENFKQLNIRGFELFSR